MNKVFKLIFVILLFASLVGCSFDTKQNETYFSYKDLTNKKIALWNGSIYDDAIKETIDNPDIQYMNVVGDMVQAMYEGKIDAVANSKTAFVLLKDEFPDLKCIDDLDYSFEIGAIFGHGDRADKIRTEYNEFLQTIEESGKKDALIKEWINSGAHGYEGLNNWDCSNGLLKVQCGFSTPPYVYVYEDGFSGYEIALVAEFGKAYHYEVEIENNDFDALLASVNTGMCDMAISGIEKTKERAEEVNYSDAEYIDKVALFCIDYDYAAPEISSLEELNGLTAAVIEGSVGYQLVEKQFPDSQILTFATSGDCCSAVISGKADFLIDDLSKAENISKVSNELTYINKSLLIEDIGFYCGKTSERQQKILGELNEFLINNKELVDELIEKWTNDLNTIPVKPNGNFKDTLVYGCSGDCEPYDFVRNNEIVGFDIDIMTLFGNEYGYNIELFITDTGGLITGAPIGKFDIGGSCKTITEERKQSLNFSTPYVSDDLVAVVRKKTEKANIFDSLLLSFEKNFIRENRYKLILNGIYSTLKISILSVFFGTIIGFAFYMLSRKGYDRMTRIFDWCSSIMDGLPMVVILMILYYVIFSSSPFDGETISIIGFSFTFSLSVYGMIRTAVKSVDIGQSEAAYSLGFSDNKAFFNIILPQALTQFMPNYKSSIVNLVKGTAVVGYIAVQDLTKASDMIRSRTYEAFFPLIMTALIYLLLGKILTLLIRRIEIQIKPEKRKKEDILKKYRK